MRFFPPLTALAVVVACACSSSEPAPHGAAPDAGVDASPATDAGKELPPSKVDVTNETVTVAGTAREYVLAVPKTLEPERPYPLVMVFHADGGSGTGMREVHPFDVASGDEAIVVYPSGIDQTWDTQTPSAKNLDISFVETLVTTLSSKFVIEPDHVFGTGHGSGAFLINKIACRKPRFFRAIVSHAGGAPSEDVDPDATLWPSGYTKCAGQDEGVAAMIVHGADDAEVPPEDGEFSATYWAALNGCQESRAATPPAPCQQYDGCPLSKPALWCLVPGLGHGVWEQGAKEGWAFMKRL